MATVQATTAPQSETTLAIRTTDDQLHALVHGEFADDTAAELVSAARTLCSSDRQQVVISMPGVTYTDSTGINALVAVRVLVEDWGGAVTLHDASPRVCQLLEITNLASAFRLTGATAE